MKRLLKFFAPVVLVSACLAASIAQAVGPAPSEYRVKAAFLYNFSLFVDWPENSAKNPGELLVCVAGHDPFGSALDIIKGKLAGDSQIQVERIPKGGNPSRCQILFISDSERNSVEALLSKLRNQPILTVSNMENFNRIGGIIQFRLVEYKIRFSINNEAAQQAGLNISSKLLRLATNVGENSGGDR